MANRVIESLERESETSHKLIKEKDDHIADLRQQVADLTKLAEERLHRIAELRRIIDAHDLTTTGFPIHPLGTAEDKPSIHEIKNAFLWLSINPECFTKTP